MVVSDLHVGSTAGLCSPKMHMDGGGGYRPSKFQRGVWRYWQHFWEEFVPSQIEKAEKTAVILNGDLIDGNHHGSVGIWTNDPDCQADNTCDMLEPVKKIGKVYVVRGTEAHSGPGSKAEERIAKELGCMKDETGSYSQWQLWLDIDNQIVQSAHHISTTSSAAYETSAPMREMITGLVEAAQWGQKLPSLFIRSHRHRFVTVPMTTRAGRVQAVITPAWQLRTPFVERIDRMRMPHIGGIVILVEENECRISEKIYPLPGPKPIKV